MPDTVTPPLPTTETFLHKVGVPLFWLSVGYLAATLLQRPRRSPINA